MTRRRPSGRGDAGRPARLRSRRRHAPGRLRAGVARWTDARRRHGRRRRSLQLDHGRDAIDPRCARLGGAAGRPLAPVTCAAGHCARDGGGVAAGARAAASSVPGRRDPELPGRDPGRGGRLRRRRRRVVRGRPPSPSEFDGRVKYTDPWRGRSPGPRPVGGERPRGRRPPTSASPDRRRDLDSRRMTGSRSRLGAGWRSVRNCRARRRREQRFTAPAGPRAPTPASAPRATRQPRGRRAAPPDRGRRCTAGSRRSVLRWLPASAIRGGQYGSVRRTDRRGCRRGADGG